MLHKRNIRDISIGTIINLVTLTLLVLITVYPFIYVVSLSISDAASIASGKVYLLPKGLNVIAYKYCFNDPRISSGFANSTLYTVIGTFISVFLIMLTAYPLSFKQLRYRRLLLRFLLITMLFSGGLIPTYIVLRSYGLINTMWAFLLPGVSTMHIIIARTFIEQLPDSLFDAAAVDGCSYLDVFWRIVIPLSMPIIATLVLWNSLGIWNAYFGPMIYLNDEKKFPLQVVLRQIVIASQFMENKQLTGLKPNEMISTSLISQSIKSAVLVISTIPVFVIYIPLQKYFAKGLLIGAIKG